MRFCVTNFVEDAVVAVPVVFKLLLRMDLTSTWAAAIDGAAAGGGTAYDRDDAGPDKLAPVPLTGTAGAKPGKVLMSAAGAFAPPLGLLPVLSVTVPVDMMRTVDSAKTVVDCAIAVGEKIHRILACDICTYVQNVLKNVGCCRL